MDQLERLGRTEDRRSFQLLCRFFAKALNWPAFSRQFVAPRRRNLPYELLLIDDGSPDDTWRVIEAEVTSGRLLRALRLTRNFGKEPALCAGLEHAQGDAVIVIDADGQHPPSLIPNMVRLWQSSGADVVEAVKQTRGRESLSSKLGAQLFYFILNKLSGFHFKGASDFKLMNRKAVDAWLKMHERNVFFRGMTVWMGSLPYRFHLKWCHVQRRIGLVSLETHKASSDRNNCVLVVPVTPRNLCGRHFSWNISSIGTSNIISEACGPCCQRFCYSHSLATDRWKPAND